MWIPLLAAAVAMADVPKPNDPIATIGGQPVLAKELEPLLWDWMARAALEDIIVLRVVENAAKKQNLTASPKEVEERLAAQMKNFERSLQPGQDLSAVMRERMLPPSRLQMAVRTDVLLDKLVLAEFKPERFAKISTLVVRPASDSAEDVQKALEAAQEAYDRLKRGESWATVVQQTVQDPNARRNDGFLGWRPLEVLPESLRAEMANLETGGITKPVQTNFGFQIFRMVTPGKAAKDEELAELKGQYTANTKPALLQRLRRETPIEIKLPK